MGKLEHYWRWKDVMFLIIQVLLQSFPLKDLLMFQILSFIITSIRISYFQMDPLILLDHLLFLILYFKIIGELLEVLFEYPHLVLLQVCFCIINIINPSLIFVIAHITSSTFIGNNAVYGGALAFESLPVFIFNCTVSIHHTFINQNYY